MNDKGIGNVEKTNQTVDNFFKTVDNFSVHKIHKNEQKSANNQTKVLAATVVFIRDTGYKYGK